MTQEAAIALWHFEDRQTPGTAERALGFLTPDERQRFRGFGDARLAGQFALRRALRRLVLAHHLDCPWTEVEIGTLAGGKPVLQGRPGSGPHFNTTDSGALSVIAVSQHAPVGVDVELAPPDRLSPVMDRLLAPAERALVAAAADAASRDALLRRAWTGKEALLKALGTGLDLAFMRRTALPLSAEPGSWMPIGGAGGDWLIRWDAIAPEGRAAPVLVALVSTARFPVATSSARALMQARGLA